MFREQELAIVKGGNTAAEKALYLTRCGLLIHILGCRKEMRGGKILQNQVFNHSNIIIHWNKEMVSVIPSGSKLEGLTIYNNQTIEKIRGLFYAICIP